MARIRAGDAVEVVDATPLAGPRKRKLPFAKGARFTVARISPAGASLGLVELPGYWAIGRFAKVERSDG